MFERLKSYLIYGNQFCGVEHTTYNNESVIYSTVLKKTKKAVDINEIFTSSSIKELTSKLAKKQHLFLIINNEHVLTKTIKSEQTDDLKLVNKAFPNINVLEFYYEVLKQDDRFFVSICRQSYIDTLIKTYTENGLYILNFSLGNSILTDIVTYIDDTITLTSNASITTENNFIKSIDLSESIQKKQYHVNGLTVSNNNLLSFSGALSYVLNKYQPVINYKDKKNTLSNTYKQIRFFSQFLKTGLIFILGILLVNFLFFNFYFEKVKALNETSQINQAAKEKILKLNHTVSKSQRMTDDMLKSSSSKSSFYINAIVTSLPETVLLSEINYQPLEKKIKKDKTIVLRKNTIIVSGDSNNSQQYSKWISILESIDWVNNIEVLDYSDLKKTSSHFSIKINMTDD
ncbi:hypothetical protein Q4Q34_07700 [Flavivirga abyssicola]|uniref:hypothetical protein n=1 Tax=Flavivirga abyssicola TaxID=3063533 RepID=UPI0026E00A89|nr:hypothetical protein [Flavivirga sp. MEBiC07777]WVK14909.1 hypothetical protein Q4Q34_07700 [Flavivirga sp. MEBiC07777]